MELGGKGNVWGGEDKAIQRAQSEHFREQFEINACKKQEFHGESLR